MSVIEEEFATAIGGKVKRKGNNTRHLRVKAERVTSGAAEVMVKVTSYGKGVGHVKAHLDYVTRNGKLEMENDRGEVFKNKEEVKEFFKDWSKDFSDGKRHKNQRDTMHVVLSMPPSTDQEAVRNGVREFAKSTFGHNHEYVFVLHTDEAHPHCHLTVKVQGFDGKRLNPGPEDLAAWREEFALRMRDEGVDAEATPRHSRGRVRKAEKQVIRHIENGDKTHQPRAPKIKVLQELDAIKELEAEAKGMLAPPRPLDEKAAAKQAEIRAAWLAAAAALEKERGTIKPIYKPTEKANERPDYGNINHEEARKQRHAVALYQRNAGNARSKEPPRSVARMRDLPGIDMVHDKRKAKVLLHANAHHRLGRGNGREAGNEMRRQGISDLGTLRGSKRLSHIEPSTVPGKELAERIRGFVEAMPAPETTHQQKKRELQQRFTKQREQTADKPAQIRQEPAPARQDPGQPPPNPKNQDYER